MLIVPVGSWYSRKKIIKSRWDKFQFPLLFFKYVVEIGEPFPVPDVINDDTLPKALADLTKAMDEVNKQAEETGKRILGQLKK